MERDKGHILIYDKQNITIRHNSDTSLAKTYN